MRREGKTIDTLLADLREPAEAAEYRLKIKAEDFRTCGNAWIEALEAYAKKQGWAIAPDNREGIRVSFAEPELRGWFLLRLSVHDPILPLNVESDVPGGVEKILAKFKAFVRDCPSDDIDASVLPQ